MSALPKNTPRRVVPRWRNSVTAATTGELTPIPTRTPIDDESVHEELARAAEDFRNNRSVGYASDLLSASVALGRPSAGLEAARFLIQVPQQAGPVALDLARRVVASPPDDQHGLAELQGSVLVEGKKIIPESTTKDPGRDVRRLRERLRDDPRNAVGWLDLSRAYAICGENDKAVRAVRAAIALAPDNRFTLRSAARFYLHVGNAEDAHEILRRSEATRRDPWLMAAEIAVATVANLPPKTVKHARAALDAQRYAPYHLSEVASALATLEANSGKTKAARRLFRQALVEPTENAVAQAEWAARHLHLFDFDHELLKNPRTFEANAWAAYVNASWEEALVHARSWLSDEPFSGRAAGMGSALAAVALENFDEAITIAKQGVLTDPNDELLRNNLVFTLAEAGRLEEARVEHQRLRFASLGKTARVMWLANGGLLEYRAGQVEVGRELYERAIALAREQGNRDLELMAIAYGAGEEFRAVPPDDKEAARIDRVLVDLDRNASPDVRLALARIKRLRERELKHRTG